MDAEIRREVTHDAVVIAASGNSLSDSIDFHVRRPEGFFAIQVELTGSGTAKIEYLLSINGEDFLTPTEAEDIKTAFTVSDGPGSDGKNMFSFAPMVSSAMKIKVTETGGASSVTVTITLVYQ